MNRFPFFGYPYGPPYYRYQNYNYNYYTKKANNTVSATSNIKHQPLVNSINNATNNGISYNNKYNTNQNSANYNNNYNNTQNDKQNGKQNDKQDFNTNNNTRTAKNNSNNNIINFLNLSPMSIGPLTFNPSSLNDNTEPVFDMFGIHLFLDDIIVIGLLIFLYQEDTKDEILYIILFLLLFA